MKKVFYFKIPLILAVFFIADQAVAQILPKVAAGAAVVGVGLLNSKKNNNPKKNNPNAPAVNKGIQFIDTTQSYDLSGKWEGIEINGPLLMVYQLCLQKTGNNRYSGYDYCQWVKNLNNTPMKYDGSEAPNAKKTFIASFRGDMLNFSEISNIQNSNWDLLNEKFRLIRNNDTLAFINSDNSYNARKIYVKRTGDFPQDNSKFLYNDGMLNVDTTAISYHDPGLLPAVKFNDKGYLEFMVDNKSGIDFHGLHVGLEFDDHATGVDDDDAHTIAFDINGNSRKALDVHIATNLVLPGGKLKMRLTIWGGQIPLSVKYLSIPTSSFFKSSTVTSPSYLSARLKAVSGYYGYSNNLYSNVSVSLDPLVASGDKLAEMWKAVFLSMSYGEYKMDEAAGYTLGKAALKAVEDRARNGDAEAIFLMFYACQLGLEGEAAKQFAPVFLEKAANAGFKPAVYDYANEFIWKKDYGQAYSSLIRSYDAGVKKAAAIIGRLYEKGYGVQPEADSAIFWYKKGMAFGDPEATLLYANMIAKGTNNDPPDIKKAVELSALAASKRYSPAMIFNGEVYSQGKNGIPKNLPVSINWFKEAAALGDRQAMVSLGEVYLTGSHGFTKDENTGLFWIKKSAQLGSPAAMVLLAKCYNEGTICEKDIIAGRFWYNQAAIAGYAQGDVTGLNAGRDSFLDFWRYADFSPSYIYVDDWGNKVGESDDGMLNGLVTGMFGAMASYYGNQQQLVDGLEYMYQKGGYKIYGGTLSSKFLSGLYLKQGQTVNIKAYGIISTGMMSGAANADGLVGWAEYRIVPTIPCSAVMAGIKDDSWQFIGQSKAFTAPKDGPVYFGVNGIDYRNYKGYFDLVVEVPVSN
jgi:TPR repeat protein